MPVIVVAPPDALFEKTVSNLQEVAARGGKLVLLTDRRGAEEASLKTMATTIHGGVSCSVSSGARSTIARRTCRSA